MASYIVYKRIEFNLNDGFCEGTVYDERADGPAVGSTVDVVLAGVRTDKHMMESWASAKTDWRGQFSATWDPNGLANYCKTLSDMNVKNIQLYARCEGTISNAVTGEEIISGNYGDAASTQKYVSDPYVGLKLESQPSRPDQEPTEMLSYPTHNVDRGQYEPDVQVDLHSGWETGGIMGVMVLVFIVAILVFR